MIPPWIDSRWLQENPDAVLADVRWYPDGRDGEEAYDQGHLAGAVYVDLESRLAGAPSDEDGRHPLPSAEAFAEAMAGVGIGDKDTVVAYDDTGGVVAARLVWMLRATGHDAALLDGGLQAWDGPVSKLRETRPATRFEVKPWPDDLLVGIEDLDALAGSREQVGGALLLDARQRERYQGEPDSLDPRAGHVPGARNMPCRKNVDSHGRLLPAEELRKNLSAVGVNAGGDPVISSCGSGVTACHTLLVLDLLGLPKGKLYPGSWSQWSRSDRPAATGPEPR